MSSIKAQTLKGFRDFLPKEERKRQYVINTLKEVFESYGFEPLETPALEYEEVLLGKYGEEGDKLMYRFTDRGGRKVALRYDQTVPLARVVAQYGNQLPTPFKRYQIQPVWRAENPQKGRFREFLQCDADIVGSDSPLSDAEIIAVAAKSLEKLGFINYKILINDRSVLNIFATEEIRVLDKIEKIGIDGVVNEFVEKGLADNSKKAKEKIEKLQNINAPERLKATLNLLKNLGLNENKFKFNQRLARGLDYYTGMIFEVEIEGYSGGSVAGGGRYDNLIGMFSGKSTPAVGFSFGFDRLVEAMDELNLFLQNITSSTTKVLVTIFSPEFKEKSIEVCSIIRIIGVNAEVYLDENTPLDKQLKYADQKGIPYVVILGPEEVEKGVVTIKNMTTGEQKEISQDQLPDEFR